MTTKVSGLRLAKRLDEVGFSDIVQIRNKVMALRAAGEKVHMLHGGEPYFETPEAIKYAAMKAMVENHTHYAPSSGIQPLREALAHKLTTKNNIPTTPDQVIATVGGSQALYGAFLSVLDPGDDALVFSPYWTPIADLIRGAQARPLLVPTSTARRNGIANTLAQFSTPNTRCIYYNTPQNPSGVVFTRAEAEEVLSAEPQILAQERRLLEQRSAAHKIRIHGDFHLGQALYTGRDFVFLDFEGEPARPLGERKLKRSALRDVAGMMRSFQYAAYSALWQPAMRQEDVPFLEKWADVWYREISSTFLQSYLAATFDAIFIPRSEADLQIALEAYLLDKAVYEIGYELNHRPDWVVIPIRGIKHILARVP